ncbi:MAG TPA: protein phosphatase CheZ [Steroidobacteraceae bacterium]|nr:protein phosphatase CheZ [Steroidobacteraceae bacterium]
MADAELLNAQYRPHVDALKSALDAGDEAAFRRSFEQLRESMSAEFMPELKRITESAQSALRRFRDQTRLDALAGHEVPDARKRLAHVVQLTDEAAHRTLDLVERSGPLVDQAAREAAELLEAWTIYGNRELAVASLWPERVNAFLERSVKDSDEMRSHLSGMLMAQGFQDLTGQIIRGVISLVGELESVLGELVRLSNGDETMRTLRVLKLPEPNLQRGVGPAVPGVSDAGSVSDQDDIDALLSKFGG